MKHVNLTPAEVVARLIGPSSVVAEIVQRDRTAVVKWRNATLRRPAGSIPGDEEKRALLTYAQAHNIPLTAEHLIWGATEAELDALLASQAREDAA